VPASSGRIAGLLAELARAADEARLLVVGYAPLAVQGADEDPLLRFVSRSLERGRLVRGSVVVLHVPGDMLRLPARTRLEGVVRELRERQVHVIAACIDPAVYGEFGDDSDAGGERVRRVSSIVDCVWVEGEAALLSLPVLSSRKLLRSLQEEMEGGSMTRRVLAVGHARSTLPRDAAETAVRGMLALGRPGVDDDAAAELFWRSAG
jgi:hypothetical protein